MDEQEQRKGANEAAFREANERLRELGETFDTVTEQSRFVCECPRADCTEPIDMTFEEYERIRSDPTRFFVAKGHEDPEVERIVLETDRYLVTEKLPGGPADIAIQEDPRS